MAELVGQGKLRHLRVLIEQLPSASRFHEAEMLDPEYLERVAQHEQREGVRRETWKPAVSEYTPELKVLGMIVDQLQAVNAGIVAISGAKPGKITPFPLPKTGYEEARRKTMEQAAKDLMRDWEGFLEDEEQEPVIAEV